MGGDGISFEKQKFLSPRDIENFSTYMVFLYRYLKILPKIVIKRTKMRVSMLDESRDEIVYNV